MQDVGTCVEADKRVQASDVRNAARQLEDVLSCGLPALYRRAYRILGNASDAEDAVQDALLSACKHLEKFRGESQMSTWLNAIVANCALMQLRRRPRHLHVSMEFCGGEQELSLSEVLADGRPSPEDEYHGHELNARLEHSVGKLSPTLRRTFHLRHVDNLSIGETAQFLGAPIGTVKAQLSRARASLKKSMRRALRAKCRPTCTVGRRG